jgi:hypothetical protein
MNKSRYTCIYALAVALAAVALASSACGTIPTPAGEVQPTWTPSPIVVVASPTFSETEPTSSLIPPGVPAATSVATDTEILVLQEVIPALQCPADSPFGAPRLLAQSGSYNVSCAQAEGHSIEVLIQRLSSPEEAQSAFGANQDGNPPVEQFHGHPAYAWQYDVQSDNVALPMRHRGHYWQADRWLIYVHAFDDTPYTITPDPLAISEAVYQAAIALGLFP